MHEPPERWPEGWWALCPSRRLGGRHPIGARRLGRRLVAWRDGEGIARVADARCPHRGTDLALGRVRDGELECAYHGFRFGADGACRAIPCEGADAKIPPGLALAGVPAVEAHGFVLAWLGSGPAAPLGWIPDAPPPQPDEAVREMVWPVRLSRAVEAMLDLHHTPFAHRGLVPPGLSRLDPYEAAFDEDGVLRSRGRLRLQGRSAGVDLRIDLLPPSVLQVSFGPRVGGVVALAPIDAETTWIGVRYFARVPVIGALPLVDRLAAELAVIAEVRLVQPDDLRMVATAEPRTGGIDTAHLVHADKAIALWHAWRRRVTRVGGADGPEPVRPSAAGAP